MKWMKFIVVGALLGAFLQYKHALGAEILVASNSVWKYLDNGTDAGTAWRAPTFDDGSWASGPAELGYGDIAEGRPEATVLSFGADANNKHITYYFRRAFTVINAATF